MIAPPANVAAWVNMFYIIETLSGRVEETLPALSGQIVLRVRGQMRITFATGRAEDFSTVTLNAPQLRSAACTTDGPVMLIGASLTPLGWHALANLPADEVHDQLVPSAAVLRPEQITMLEAAAQACRAGCCSPEDVIADLVRVIAAAPFTPRADHVAVVEAMAHWLDSDFDPPLAALHAAVAISPRQLQRISRRFFGVAPAQALKRYRAIRAAMMFAHSSELAQRDEIIATYFDQAHLIRDIRRYTGRTPTQLRAHVLATGLDDPAVLTEASAFLRGDVS